MAPRNPPVDPNGPVDTGDNQALVGRPQPLPRSDAITSDAEGHTIQSSPGGSTGSTSGDAPGGGGGGAPVGGCGPGPTNGGPGAVPTSGILPGPGGGEGNNWEGSGPGGGSAQVPGVVNTQTGNRMTTLPVVGWNAYGQSFGLTLYHNAQDNIDVGWGQNWRSNFDIRVIYTGNVVSTPTGNRDYLTVVYPTGKRIAFTRLQSGPQGSWGPAFYPPAGYYDMVFAAPGGGYTLRTKDQHVYNFDANGYLTWEQNRYGNRINVTFAGGRLQKATDFANRNLTFTWGTILVNTSSGLQKQVQCLSSVRSSGGQTWTFMQDAGPLMNADDAGLKYLTGLAMPQSTTLGSNGHGFGYTVSGAIASESAQSGGVHRFYYDDNLRLTRFTDPLGNATTYTYNSSNTVRTNPDGGQQTDFYDAGVLRSEQDEAGFGRTYTYDSNYNVTQLLDERGNVQNYEYDAFGNRTSGQDPRQNAAGVKLTATYNSYNDPMTAADARGATTTLHRDSLDGVLLSVTDGMGSTVETNQWNAGGLLTRTIAGGVTTDATYDRFGNVETVTGPNGTATLVYGDAHFPDRPTSWSDPQRGTTSVQYDDWGRLAQVTRGDGATMSLEHDAAGQVTKVTDWLGHVTRFAYDTAGAVSKTDALGQVERYGYDGCDRVTTITDGRNKVRTYRYTLRGEVAQLTLPDNSTERYRYDAGGNQTVRINSMGQATTYAYDAADDLASVTYPSGPGVTYTYDLDGRSTSMTDGTGTSSWSYDNADRTTGLVTPQGSQSYGYDQYGNRSVVGMENGAAIQTNVLGAQVVSVVKSPENETTQYAYDNVGRLLTQTLPSGAITTYGYDALSRVNGIVHRRPGNPGSVISSETYSYDAGGNLTYKVVDGVRTDYAYDAIDQLLSETTAGGSSLSYTYDANGNRLTKTANGVTETYAYDDGDKLLSRSGALTGGVNYAYDACDRTTSVVSTAGGGTTTLSYDYEDRLTRLQGVGVDESYVYNGADARVGKSGTAGSRTYRRDGVGVTSPVLSDGLATMVPGISERSNGVTRFSHLDRLGTNAKTTDASANVVDFRSYDAFGLPTQMTNPSHSEQGFASAFGYQEDAESGLKLLGHRYYDPGAGRFITRDRAQDGLNWYAYAANNPLKYYDDDGNKIKWVGGTFGERLAIVIALMNIAKTAKGKTFANEVLYGPQEYTITIVSDGTAVKELSPGRRSGSIRKISSTYNSRPRMVATSTLAGREFWRMSLGMCFSTSPAVLKTKALR